MELGNWIKWKDLFQKKPIGLSISENYTKITNGLRKKEVHLFIAPSGTGKTRIGVGVASELLRQNQRVVYLTFEQEETDIAELVVRNFGGDSNSEELWENTISKLPLKIFRFEPKDEQGMIDVFGSFSGADAIIIDYLTVPWSCGLEGPETSGTLQRMTQAIHKIAEKNNQFIWCMMQGKPRDKEDKSFATSAMIWGSRQVINAAEVVTIAQRTEVKDQLDIDVIKARYGRYGANLRLKWNINYETCEFYDVGPIWYSDTEEELNTNN